MPVEVARIEFSQKEYRTIEVQDAAILVKHPLAVELNYRTLLANSADATTFGNQVLNLRKLDRWTWACYVKKDNYPTLEIGQTIRLVHPRFGFDAGKNFIIKRVKTDSNAVFDELTLFGPE